jgi:anti-sigma B factor antagonist
MKQNHRRCQRSLHGAGARRGSGRPTWCPCPAQATLTLRDCTHEGLAPRTTITAAGYIDLSTAPRLARHLNHSLHRVHRGSTLVIDLAQVSFLGATGVSVLVRAAHTARSHGIAFHLTGCNRPTLRLLGMMNLRTTLLAAPIPETRAG